MFGIHVFEITLSICAIKMIKSRSHVIFGEFKSLESFEYCNIRPDLQRDIQISEYVRNSELHLRT